VILQAGLRSRSILKNAAGGGRHALDDPPPLADVDDRSRREIE
jgi:hypothetical protein